MRLFLIYILLTIGILAHGQTYPVLTNYSSDALVINPSYAGYEGVFTVSGLCRWQWVGFEGAPSTYLLSAHTPLKKENVALGFLLMNEVIGSRNNLGIFLNYSYRLKFNTGTLALGLKMGFNNLNKGNVELRDDAYDNTFDGNISVIQPNVGVGFMYEHPVFYAGLSVPMLFSYETTQSGSSTFKNDFSAYNFYFLAGGTYPVNTDIILRPGTLFIYNKTLKNSFTIDVKALYQKVYEAGLGIRFGEAIILLLGYKVSNQISAGYSYDFNIGNIGGYTSGSHEIHFKYRFGYKVSAENPRNF